MKYKTETDPNSTKEKEKQTHFYCCSSRPFLLLATTILLQPKDLIM
jgi:hypothetical protein